jgi:pimeloyl-ACP methyl ester carboxylesterase
VDPHPAAQEPPVSDTIRLQGIDLPYERRGAGAPMVLLHGGGGPLAQAPVFARLTERFEVIAPVHPGFAGTPIPEHFDGMEDLVYLYLDLLDALELRDAVLMGFSMGGWAAAEIAVRSTARLSRLVLVDAVGIKPGGRDTRDVVDVFGTPAAELARIMYHDPASAPNLADASDEQMAVAAGNRTALALYTWEPYMHNPKLPHRLHRVDVPTLLVWGESDGLVTVDYARAYQRMIPGAELVTIPRAGHAPQTEQPEAFLETVLAFTNVATGEGRAR